jgi:UDPglucose--hexose-1-phosphate uridylyltransferase
MGLPEIRFDVLSAAFAVIAQERSKRPSDYKTAQDKAGELPEKDPKCPFCPGNEGDTPPEVWANRREGTADSPGWTVRVVPNKFPALIPRPPGAEEDEAWRIPPFPESPEGPLYWQAPGVGSHEVVIESPAHNGSLGSYSIAQMKRILGAIKERFAAIYDTKDIAYVQVFKNGGKTAGASLTHPHFQIIGLPVMPPTILSEWQRLRDYESKTRRCLVCDLLEREAEKDVRVILRNDRFLVLSPFASRRAYETLIVPTEHVSGFSEMNDAMTGDLAASIQQLFGAYESMFSSLPYNMVFHGLPSAIRTKRGWPYHAHIHVYPRLNTEAGLELGSGTYINPTSPELATREFIAAIRNWEATECSTPD